MLSIIVLAAGLSTRFGRNKLLYAIGGIPMIKRVVQCAIQSEADEVVVVLGHQSELVRQTLRGLSCRFVVNHRFWEGQSSSVKKGITSVKKHADAVLILPGDIAYLTPRSINAVIREYQKKRGPIVVAAHEDKIGHPILIDRSLFNEVMKISEHTSGLKLLFDRHGSKITRVEVESSEVIIDIDTPADLEKSFHLLERLHE